MISSSMLLSISLDSTTPGLPGIPAEQQFATFPISIGRDPECDLVLPDASKYVSSRHAQLNVNQGQLELRDSSANGTYINGSTERIRHGTSVVLSNGDVLAMGTFRLELTVLSTTPTASALVDPQAETIAYRANEGAAPERPLGDASVVTDDSTDTQPVSKPATARADTSTEQRKLDASDTPGQRKPNPLDQLPPQKRIAQLDQKNTPASTDATQINPQSAANASNANAPDSATGSLQVMQTLLTAAGLDPDDFADIDAELLAAHTGQVLNRSIHSMMLLLRARDELKNTMRAEMTLLAAEDNNPLRFSVSAEDSLGKLLQPNAVTGFTDANTALDQALRDIKIHQMAMLEATRSALNIVLSHFDPETLASNMRANSPLAANMPLAREAKLWDEFKARYDGIKNDAMEDFNDIFGRELRKAYEKSVSELKKASDPL
jgi:type VI secretion system FHA domain protein